MNPAGCEGFPTSTLIMPFFNMFKSRRGRSTSLPRAPERYLHESEVYNQASAYGPHSSGFGRPARPAQPHAGFRAQRNPSHASSFSNSVSERYGESPTNDQSWYRVEHPDYSAYRGPRDRDPDDFSYSEEGDQHSDSDGTVTGRGVPIHTLSESTGTGLESPVPTVHRQGSPQSSSRMYEQMGRSPRIPKSVTRLDLHEGVEGGYDRHRRGAPPPARSNSLRHTASQNRQAYGAGSHRHGYHNPPHRQPSQHAFQGPVHGHVPTDSSRSASDVMQVMDNGDRIAIPRQHLERRRLAPRESYNYESNNKRTFYIVPPGMNVIFRDEFGNELKRVGDFSGGGSVGGDDLDSYDSYDEAPVELTDERGHVVYKTGENYTDDGSDVSEATFRPQVVHLGQYVSNGRPAKPRSTSPITVSLDRRGYHKHIQLDSSEDGSFGGSQETDRSFSPRLSHTRSEGHLAGFGSLVRPHLDQVRLRTVYP